MATKVDVKRMAEDLHTSKLINLEAPAKSFIDVAGAYLANAANAGADDGGSYGVAWSHYVIICGAEAAAQVEKIASNPGSVRG